MSDNANYEAVDPQPEPQMTPEQSAAASRKAKGMKQMVAGGVIAAAGVPMLVLPGPGVAAIAGGAALMGRGYQNMTGKDVIDEETRQDPKFQQGQKVGEEWAQRMKDFAVDELAPASKEMASGAKSAASAAVDGIKGAAGAGVDLTQKGFRAFVGDDAADKTEEFVDKNLSPVAQAAGAFANGVWQGVKPSVGKAAEAGGKVASQAGQKIADAAKDLMK